MVSEGGGGLVGRALHAGRFVIEAPLGRGGMGRLYVAEDTAQGDRCVLKELDFARLEDLKALELFEREVAVMQTLQHPQIPAYRAHFTLEEAGQVRLFLAQDKVPGQDLEALREQGQRFSTAEVLRIGRAVIDVLIYLHRQRPPIIHRDIKPSNIVLRPDGVPCLVDFGAVRHTIEESSKGGSTVVGTFGYMAPEQLRGHAEPATDVYGLGATLLFLLTGRDPADFEQSMMRLDLRRDAGLSEPVLLLLEAMLEPAVEVRRGTMGQLLRAFERVARGSLPFLPDDGPVSPQARARATVDGRNPELPPQVKALLTPHIVQLADDVRDLTVQSQQRQKKLEEVDAKISFIDRLNFLYDTPEELKAKALKGEITALNNQRGEAERRLMAAVEERALADPLFAMRRDFEEVHRAVAAVKTRKGQHHSRPTCPVYNLDKACGRLDRAAAVFRDHAGVQASFDELTQRLQRGAIHADRKVLEGLAPLERGIIDRAVGQLRQRGFHVACAEVERLEAIHAQQAREHKAQKGKIGFWQWINVFHTSPEEVQLQALARQLGGTWAELSQARTRMQEALQAVLDGEALLQAMALLSEAQEAVRSISARPVERTITHTRTRRDGSVVFDEETVWECELVGVSRARASLQRAEAAAWELLGRPLTLDELKASILRDA